LSMAIIDNSSDVEFPRHVEVLVFAQSVVLSFRTYARQIRSRAEHQL